jgi:hypothetical protein
LTGDKKLRAERMSSIFPVEDHAGAVTPVAR